MAEHFRWQGRRIWIAGHTGLVGSALLRLFEGQDAEILTVTHSDLDLCRQQDVEDWMRATQPDVVLLAAARVGGIGANRAAPAEFLYENLAIAQNIIHQSWQQKVSRLVYLGSSCIYPRLAAQPIQEDALLSGPLEPTNEAYAIAKITGIKLCQFYRQQYGADFISVMPCNLYCPGDRWDEASGHVIPALIQRLYAAKRSGLAEVSVWGSGKQLREFLYVDDLARAVLTALESYADGLPLNAGSGAEISIAELAERVKQVTGYGGALLFDPSQPDGTPRKVLDSSRLRRLGWAPQVDMTEGLKLSYADFCRS